MDDHVFLDMEQPSLTNARENDELAMLHAQLPIHGLYVCLQTWSCFDVLKSWTRVFDWALNVWIALSAIDVLTLSKFFDLWSIIFRPTWFLSVIACCTPALTTGSLSWATSTVCKYPSSPINAIELSAIFFVSLVFIGMAFTYIVTNHQSLLR